MKKISVLAAYTLSLLSVALGLISLQSVIVLLNPGACNNIWGSHVCPTLVALPASYYYMPFISLGLSIILAFAFYKLAHYMRK